MAGSIDDREFSGEVQRKSAIGAGVVKHLEVNQWIASLLQRLSPHKDLQDLVAAAEEIDGRHNTNQQMAQKLGTTAGDVTNRKKRILRILFGETK